jgi:hypothetical protein
MRIDHETLTRVLSKMLGDKIIRLVESYIYAKSPEEKTLQINVLQKVYEMGDL